MLIWSGARSARIRFAAPAVSAAVLLAFSSAQAQSSASIPRDSRVQPVPVAPAPPASIRPSKIILVGDSTMQMGSGWGGRFCARRVSSILSCLNLARGGRSTTSYRREGSWDLALAEMATPGYVKTYVLIQFGHNDQHPSAERHADPDVAFPENLRQFVREARAQGAVPVLVTPLTRRQFVDGALQNDLEPWTEATRRVAAEMAVPLLDLNADSRAAVQAMGPFIAAQFAPESPSGAAAAALLGGSTVSSQASGTAPVPPAPATAPGSPWAPARQAFDYTHLGEFGADFFSAMVTRELAAAVPELQRALYP
jgi:lysophospholipase L1-like esterase